MSRKISPLSACRQNSFCIPCTDSRRDAAILSAHTVTTGSLRAVQRILEQCRCIPFFSGTRIDGVNPHHDLRALLCAGKQNLRQGRCVRSVGFFSAVNTVPRLSFFPRKPVHRPTCGGNFSTRRTDRRHPEDCHPVARDKPVPFSRQAFRAKTSAYPVSIPQIKRLDNITRPAHTSVTV